MGLVWQAHRGLTLLLGFIAIGQAAVPALTSWAGKLIIDSLLAAVNSSSPGWRGIASAMIFAGCVAVGSLLLGTAAQSAQAVLRERLTYRISSMIMRKTLTLDLEFFETPDKQDMLQRATMEVGYRPLGVLQSIFDLVRGTITLISVSVLLLHFSVWVVGLLVLTGLPALFVQTKFGRESFALLSGRAPSSRKAMYFASLLTQVWPAKEVILFGLGQHLVRRYEEMMGRFARENTSLALRRGIASSALQLLGQVGYYAAYVAVIAEVLQRRLTIGDMTLYSGLLMQVPAATASMVLTIAGLFESSLFLANLYNFLAVTPRIAIIDGTGLPAPSKLVQGIRFENVSFRYPGSEKEVLHNVSMSIRPGEKVAIVGENGAGKTTLVKLLTRLYDPTGGRIVIDGRDLRSYDLSSLQSRVAVILQDFVRYNLTARENVGFGKVDALQDIERIRAAAARSGADELIEDLPNGYETVLGRWFVDRAEEAVDLSLGQWQKIALARAMMRETPILVLDEPTASLDARAEYEVFQHFREITGDRTAILISHRFSTVRTADQIVVFEAGAIVESGTHAQLVAAGGLYARLFQLQAQWYR